MILSPRRMENSGLAGVERISRFPLVDISRSIANVRHCLKFSTIHSFKGLESPVVIIIDIEQLDSDEPQSLLYVAMSRARSLLILMISEAARTSLERRIRAGMKQELYPPGLEDGCKAESVSVTVPAALRASAAMVSVGLAVELVGNAPAPTRNKLGWS